ncbi:hypothetical protein G9A89_001458 [Geosiphon pyriformis]|nr:hypothetical protein G9A89_001458 [Geosiphon pyriformis]
MQQSDDSNKGFPEKRAINSSNYDEIEELRAIAALSNIPYCIPLYGLGNSMPNNIIADVITSYQTKTIVIIFKGIDLTTIEWEARKNNLTTFEVVGMKKNNLVKVDEDWFLDVLSLMNMLLEKVIVAVKETGHKKILFCGHGVGGAYAAITGLSFAIMNLLDANLPLDISIGTLGQPRVGNIMFARMMNEIVRVIRITHYNDYFPHFPPIENESTIMQHHEREIWIEIDCNCSQNTDEVIWDCGQLEDNQEKKLVRIQQFIRERFWTPGDNLAMENMECNAGQTITDSSRDNHFGPYFGTTIGDCTQFSFS